MNLKWIRQFAGRAWELKDVDLNAWHLPTVRIVVVNVPVSVQMNDPQAMFTWKAFIGHAAFTYTDTTLALAKYRAEVELGRYIDTMRTEFNNTVSESD